MSLKEVTDETYESVRLSVERHLELHGTLNIEQFRRLIDSDRRIAIQWLDYLVHNRVIREHSHGKGVLYTRA